MSMKFIICPHMEIVIIEKTMLSFAEHIHSGHIVLSAVTDGNVLFSKGKKSYKLKTGDIFTVYPYEAHSVTSHDPAGLISVCIPANNPPESKVGDIIAQMEKDPCRPFSTEAAARQSHYSLYHFIRLFSKSTGATPYSFLLIRRIRAAQMLLLTGASCAQAAAECGFFDQSHFDKTFRRIVGIAPCEYKKSAIIYKTT